MDQRGATTVRLAGRKGGKNAADKHGADFYREIGRRGGEARRTPQVTLLLDSFGYLRTDPSSATCGGKPPRWRSSGL